MQEKPDTRLRCSDGTRCTLATPGPQRHNSLLVDTVELFGPRYTPGALILHLWDTANHVTIFEQERLKLLGIPEMGQALCPDIVLYQEEKRLLFLIDVETSRGSISLQRKYELERQCGASKVRRVYVSAFYDRVGYKQHAEHLAWGTYVWMAYIPDHAIFHW